jgi:ABC-2 type transport system permease protein
MWVDVLVIPLLFLFLFGLSIGGLVKDVEYGGQAISYFLFLVPGILGMCIINSANLPARAFVEDKNFGILEGLLTCPISRSSYLLAAFLYAITLSIVPLLLVLFVGVPLIEKEIYCSNIFLVLISILLGVICFSSLSMTIMSIIKSPEFGHATWALLMPLIVLCSSMYYSLESAPSWFRTIALLNPATYMADVMRFGLIGGELSHWILMEILILLAFTSAFLIIVTISMRRIHV